MQTCWMILHSLIPECDWKTYLIVRAHCHCFPSCHRKWYEREEKDLWKVKRQQTHSASRKETPCFATGTMSVCLFYFSVSQKRFKGKEEVALLKNVCQAFIVTVAIYRNSGNPWKLFSPCCFLYLSGTLRNKLMGRHTGDLRMLILHSCVLTLTPEHRLVFLLDSGHFLLFVPLSQTLPHGCSYQLSPC